MDTIEDLRAYLRNTNNVDLYVVNESHLKGKRKRSECIFTVSSGGENKHIVVKDTYIPQNIGLKVENLSDYARSEEFQNFIRLGFLKPIDPDSAEEFLRTPDGRAELSRLNGLDVEDDLSTESVQIASSRKVNAAPKVVSLMMNDMDGTKKIAALKNIASELTGDDIKYIMQQAKDEKVKAWASSFSR